MCSQKSDLFDFFLRFQRNYIKNAIKVFDKTSSQLFLIARKKSQTPYCRSGVVLKIVIYF